jgi:hypothetical protein
MQTFLKDKPVTVSTLPSNTGAPRKSRRRGNGVANDTASNAQGHGLLHPGRGGSQEAQAGVSVSFLL